MLVRWVAVWGSGAAWGRTLARSVLAVGILAGILVKESSGLDMIHGKSRRMPPIPTMPDRMSVRRLSVRRLDAGTSGRREVRCRRGWRDREGRLLRYGPRVTCRAWMPRGQRGSVGSLLLKGIA